MALELLAGDAPAETPLIGIPFFEDGNPAVPGQPVLDAETRKRRGFEGKAGQTMAFDVDGRTVVGFGLGKAADSTLDTLRRAAASFVKAAAGVESAALHLVAVDVPGADVDAKTQVVVEGVRLGNYRFGEYKTKADDRKLSQVHIVGATSGGLDRGELIADAVCRTRDLINQPPAAMTPTRFAEIATEMAADAGLDISVWDEHRIESEGMGGLRGVSLGSDQPPRFVEINYKPVGATKTLALVGKGITFDSGGLSLKPNDGMLMMKSDMSGAASVVAAVYAIAKLGVAVNVIALAPLTENMPGPKATKISDVLVARNGKTIEVMNTDAEGRLVLMDALSIAVERDVDAIVDVATLTGAVMVALGTEVAGMMGNNDEFIGDVKAAAERTGEALWHLPLPPKYRKLLDSHVADMKNVGTRMGGALTAGVFLQEFVADKPWVHLDIAGTAFVDADDTYISKGATGYGVRTLIDLAENFA